jgi:anti-sigma factor RsiW
LERPPDKHIDNKELNALVATASETGEAHGELSADTIRVAERHLGSCTDCSSKVEKYRQLVAPVFDATASKAAPRGVDCPWDEHVDWHEVAAGFWPELKARQLIMHSAICDHCGPLLRAATALDDEPTPQEEKLLARLKAPTRPEFATAPVPRRQLWSPTRWLIPAVALIVIVGVLLWKPSSPRLSGPDFVEFAVNTHRQLAQGNLALDVHSDSEQILNEWFKAHSPFSLALPSSTLVPGERRPYHLEGARLVRLSGKTAAYIAYRIQASPVGLLVTPDSIATASGGVKLDFKRVSFHYAMRGGYKVVTWSSHGLTYALVSSEGNSSQQSCMVCHSAMRDRDLNHTPTPLPAGEAAITTLWQ